MVIAIGEARLNSKGRPRKEGFAFKKATTAFGLTGAPPQPPRE